MQESPAAHPESHVHNYKRDLCRLQVDICGLKYDDMLERDDKVTNAQGQALVLQGDGNIVVYEVNNHVAFASNTNDVQRLFLQGDGNVRFRLCNVSLNLTQPLRRQIQTPPCLSARYYRTVGRLSPGWQCCMGI